MVVRTIKAVRAGTELVQEVFHTEQKPKDNGCGPGSLKNTYPIITVRTDTTQGHGRGPADWRRPSLGAPGETSASFAGRYRNVHD